MSNLEIGGRQIGEGSCFVIAEAGVNHNGDFDLARRLIDVAVSAGVDAVKFQTFQPELLVSPDGPMADYQAVNTGGEGSQLEMLRGLSLSTEAFEKLAQHAADQDICFLSTAFDEPSVDFLETLGVPAFKVPSGEITNHPFLSYIAGKAKPVLLSTGMSSSREVVEAVKILQTTCSAPFALLHCVTNYPALPAECNLRAIDTMRELFEVPVGWSDHTDGIAIGIAAVARGAAIIEKHFTLDRSFPGPDHAASIEPETLITFVKAVRDVDLSLGDGIKRPTPSEQRICRVVRRSLHLRRDLPQGHVLIEADLVALRPGGGIPPGARQAIVGRRLCAEFSRGHLLQEIDLD